MLEGVAAATRYCVLTATYQPALPGWTRLPTISSPALTDAALSEQHHPRPTTHWNDVHPGLYASSSTPTPPPGLASRASSKQSRTRNRYVTPTDDMNESARAVGSIAQQGGAGAGAGNVAIEIEADDGSIGQGRVVDPDALGGRNAWSSNGSSNAPIPSRSHYHLSRNEVMKGLANRFVHSTGYIYFYAGMAIASLLTVFISLLQECPGTLFYSLELAINALLIAEVGVRGYAFGKQFWKSTFNIVDLCLVLLCAITLIVLFFSHDCSPYRRGDADRPGPGEDIGEGATRGGKSEELLDSLLLILRNGAQLFRLLSVVRRSSSNVTTRVPNIDLDEASRFSLDLDLEEEGLAARERMADGGDRGARLQRERQKQQNGGAAAGGGAGLSDERRQLFDYDDEDDEL